MPYSICVVRQKRKCLLQVICNFKYFYHILLFIEKKSNSLILYLHVSFFHAYNYLHFLLMIFILQVFWRHSNTATLIPCPTLSLSLIYFTFPLFGRKIGLWQRNMVGFSCSPFSLECSEKLGLNTRRHSGVTSGWEKNQLLGFLLWTVFYSFFLVQYRPTLILQMCLSDSASMTEDSIPE